MPFQGIKTLSFYITYRCPNRCIFCDIKYIRNIFKSGYASCKEIGVSRIKEILKEAKECKLDSIVFTGGEPFLRKDIFDIIDYCSKIDLPLGINTRYIFTAEDIPRLKSPSLKMLWCSIDSCNKKTAENLAGRSDFFNRYIHGIRLLVKNGISISVISVINRMNVNEIDNLLEFIYNLGIKIVHLRVMSLSTLLAMDYKRDNEVQMQRLALSSDEMESLRKKAVEWKNKLDILGVADEPDTQGDPQPRCGILNGTLTIRPDGKVVYCALAHDLVIGDLVKEGLTGFLNSRGFRSLAKPARADFKGTRCFRCRAFSFCNSIGRCYKENYRRYKRLFLPDETLCQRFIRD